MSAITRRIEGLDAAANFSAAYRTVWRRHFYAGLFCLPFIIVRCFSGAIYLFRPQIDAWLDRVIGVAAHWLGLVAAAPNQSPV